MGLFGLFKRKDKENQRKYQLGMKKTRSGLMGKLQNLFSHYNEITEDFFDELTDIFIMADIGVETTLDFIEELKADERVKDVKDVSELQPIIVDKMFELYLQQEIVRVDLNVQKDGLSVFLFVGVNGSGKTTSIAKVAYKLKQEKKKVLKSLLQVHCHFLMKKRVLLRGMRSVLTLLHLAFLTLFQMKKAEKHILVVRLQKH